MRLFQESCGYVTQKCDLLAGLSVSQTLHYAAMMTIGSKVNTHRKIGLKFEHRQFWLENVSTVRILFQVSSYVKKAKVKQVMADLALSPIGNRQVEHLSQSEYRRLTIGVQLVRDPVVLLLDEPTWDLDPLNTYFVVSILANHAKKYNRIVLLTMEKPRSDIFPFLDR